MDKIRCLGAHEGKQFKAINGDCVDVLSQFPDNSIGFSVYSPPFGSLFVYSEGAADMGNSTDDEFAEHYAFLVKEKMRITMPGRLTAVHCSDLPMTKWKDGAVGIKDFSGQIIRAHEDAGWIYHGRRTIWKCPVVEMTRTKHVGLLYKQLQKDSSKSRGGMPDYLLTFIKPGDNPEPYQSYARGFSAGSMAGMGIPGLDERSAVKRIERQDGTGPQRRATLMPIATGRDRARVNHVEQCR